MLAIKRRPHLSRTGQPKPGSGHSVTLTLPDGTEIVVQFVKHDSGGRIMLGFEMPEGVQLVRDDAKIREKKICDESIKNNTMTGPQRWCSAAPNHTLAAKEPAHV